METSGGEKALCPKCQELTASPDSWRFKTHIPLCRGQISHGAVFKSLLPEPPWLIQAGLGRLVLFNEMKYIHSMRGVFSRRKRKNGGIHT